MCGSEAATRLSVLRSEQTQIEREQFPQEQAERYLEFLKGYLILKYRIYRQGRSRRLISNLYSGVRAEH